MGKRKTLEDYERLGESRGFEWIGPEVKNTKVKTWWRCPDGHKFESRYNDVDQGHGCPRCYNCVPKTIKDYHALALFRGFKCLEKEIRGNNKSNVLWECEQSHRWWASFNGVSKGNGCPHCYGNARKVPGDYVILAMSKGFKWIGPEVPNTRSLTTWECGRQQHRWRANYGNIKNGWGCPYCSNSIPKTEEDYHELALSKELEWKGTLPPTVHSLTTWCCSNTHCWESTHTRIRLGDGCPICANRVPKTQEDYYKLAASREFTWLGPMVSNNKTKTEWECNRKQHRWSAAYNQIQGGNGCPECRKETLSKRMRKQWADGVFDGVFQSPTSIEIAISDALNKFDIEHCSQYRPEDYSRSFDEFIYPDLLLEINGDWWHCNPLFFPEEDLNKAQLRRKRIDGEKKEWAIKNGYQFITIWEHEIEERGAKELIRSHILPLLEDKDGIGSKAS